MKILTLPKVDSTNNYVASHAAELDDMTMVTAIEQTAGRGQRGNSWESEPGKNLTFTLLYRPTGVAPGLQFSISEAAALAMADALDRYGIEAKIKWPNDIYAGDRKIAGILIEHSLTPELIEHSRIGIGLNVNQTEFRGSAPNPVSMAMLCGKEHDRDEVAAVAAEALERRLPECEDEGGRTRLHEEFLRRLWRHDGRAYKFKNKKTDETFTGRMADVDRKGLITVRNEDRDRTETFAFKEIEFIL